MRIRNILAPLLHILAAGEQIASKIIEPFTSGNVQHMYLEVYHGGSLVSLSKDPKPDLRPTTGEDAWHRLSHGSLK